MKATINLEFSDRELEDFVVSAASKWALRTIGAGVEDVLNRPGFGDSLLRLFQQAIAVGARAGAGAASPATSGAVPAAADVGPVAAGQHGDPPPPVEAPDAVIADWLRAQSPPPPPVPDAALAAMYRAQAGVGAGLRPGAGGCGPDAG